MTVLEERLCATKQHILMTSSPIDAHLSHWYTYRISDDRSLIIIKHPADTSDTVHNTKIEAGSSDVSRDEIDGRLCVFRDCRAPPLQLHVPAACKARPT